MEVSFFNARALVLTVALSASASLAGDITPPPLDTPYDQWTWLATHNAYANPEEGFDSINSNQPHSITEQLNYGVRTINPDIWLVRQKQQIGPLGVCKWLWEEYPGPSTDVRDSDFTGLPLQVVVGHGDNDSLIGSFRQPCTPWKTLQAELNDIGAWLEAHPNEVVTVVFETKINGIYETNYINPAINGSRMAKFIFNPSRSNPSVPAPDGRPGGWYVDWYGYPTLRQLVQAGKRAVLFPPYLPSADADGHWKLDVMTVYGHRCLPPPTTTTRAGFCRARNRRQ